MVSTSKHHQTIRSKPNNMILSPSLRLIDDDDDDYKSKTSTNTSPSINPIRAIGIYHIFIYIYIYYLLSSHSMNIYIIYIKKKEHLRHQNINEFINDV